MGEDTPRRQWQAMVAEKLHELAALVEEGHIDVLHFEEQSYPNFIRDGGQLGEGVRFELEMSLQMEVEADDDPA